MTASATVKKRKSERLTDAEQEALKAYRAGFPTEVACALSIGVDRLVLNRVQLTGSGSPEYIKKIRLALKKALRKDAGTAQQK